MPDDRASRTADAGAGTSSVDGTAHEVTAPELPELPAPYELEEPVDDLALTGVALGGAGLLVALLAGLPALGPAVAPVGWLVGVGGLVVSGLAVRRRASARRLATVGVALSAAALLVSLVLAVVAAVAVLLRAT